MPNYVVTYNIDNATNRAQFVTDFETVLQGLGLQKENTNQSTYFGNYPHRPGQGQKLGSNLKKRYF